VTPQRSGTHTLAGVVLTLDDATVTVPATQIVVRSKRPAVAGCGQLSTLARRLRLSIGQLPSQIYEGQIFPVDITLSVPRGLRIKLSESNFPQKIGECVHSGSDTHGTVDAIVAIKPFSESGEASWRTLLTATSHGNLSLSFVLGLLIESDADEPIFSKRGVWRGWENFFPDNTKWIPVTVATQKIPLTVLPLPQEGWPSDFTGAIGEFELLPPRVSRSASNGDGCSEVNIIIPVHGVGNLYAIRAPRLILGEQWRMHRVSTCVHADDKLGECGTIEFSYHLVRQREGAVIPQFVFTYFSPTSGRYEYIKHDFYEKSESEKQVAQLQSISLTDILPMRENFGKKTLSGKCPDDLTFFFAGNSAFSSGNYAMAVDFYGSISSHVSTAALLQNLSVAQAYIGKLGYAILNLRRALLLEPNNSKLIFALNRLLTTCQLQTLCQSKWQSFVQNFLITQWRTITLFFAFVSLTFLCKLIFSRRSRAYFVVILLCISALSLSIYCLSIAEFRRNNAVVVDYAQVYEIPSSRSPVVGVLPIGSSVVVTGELNGMLTINYGAVKHVYISKNVCEFICP
jgi:hypothetical protein